MHQNKQKVLTTLKPIYRIRQKDDIWGKPKVRYPDTNKDSENSYNPFNPKQRVKARHNISTSSVPDPGQRKLNKTFSNSNSLHLQPSHIERQVIQSNINNRLVGISNSVPKIKIKSQAIIKNPKQKLRTAAAPSGQQPSVRTSMKAATTRTERPVSTSTYDRSSYEKEQESLNEMYRKSSLSLLEQKKLQWAQEREELNGLWSPWGRPTDTLTSSMAASSSTTAIISSNYATRLGVSSASQSEYHLPPISTTIAQQPRKSSLWSSEENTNNGPVYTNANNNTANNNNNGILSRKSSLPICIATSVGDIHFNGGNTVELKHHPYQQSNNNGNNNHNSQNMNMMTVSNGWGSFDEDTFTSGYQSENNGCLSNGDGEYSRNGSGDYHHREEDQEQDYEFDSNTKGLMPRRKSGRGNSNSGVGRASARSRSEGGPKNYDDKSGSPSKGNKQYNESYKKKSKVIVHNVLTENENRQEYEYTVNALTSTEMDSQNSGLQTCIYSSRSNPNLSQSGRIISNPPPPAMRSSITFGIDAANVADYKEIEKQEREQWLNELEKQREEQRLRREMEKEDRERPRWGDKGIGVGHFWEPSESTNARLPPPGSSRGENDQDAQSTPAWLEKGLHRMESSKSTPSLNEVDMENYQEGSPSPSNLISNQHQSAIDLRNVAGFDNNDPNSERTFVRGQNVPGDPDIHAEREKKRQAALEHQDAIRKQMEERQARLKQEREKKILEEKNEEERITRQQQLELERLEAERRKISRGKENDDDFGSSVISSDDFIESPKKKNVSERQQNRKEFAESKTKLGNVSTDDNTGRELAMRQSMFLPNLGESKSMINITEEIVSQEVITEEFIREIERQDQSIMTEVEDLAEVRVLTPTLQRSRSFGTAREFGTQTEYSETNSSSEKSSAKNKSHTCLTEKGMEKEAKKSKKKMEKPRWGENPVKKQYLKNSEKDPVYQQRLRRRMERMKRREEEIIIGDTGTESEELNIPLNRQIRIRKNESPPRSLAPMRAKVPIKNFKNNGKDKTARDNIESYMQYQSESLKLENIQKKNSSGDGPPGRNKIRANPVNSEESSGFSSPSIEVPTRRSRDIGAGDSLEYEDYSYRTVSMHQEQQEMKTSRISSSSLVSEYMGELPSNINRKSSKADILPNKSTKTSINRSQDRVSDEKPMRKSSITKTTPPSHNPSSKARSAAEMFDDQPIHVKNPPTSSVDQHDSYSRSFEQRRSPPIPTLAQDSLETSFEAQDSLSRSFEQRMTRSPPIPTLAHEAVRTSFEAQESHTSFEQRIRRSPPIPTLAQESMGTSFEAQDSQRSFEQRMRRSPPIPTLAQESMRTSYEAQDSQTSFEQRMRRSPPISTLEHDSMGTGTSYEAQDSHRSFEQRIRRSPPISTLAHDSIGTGTSFEAQDSQRSFEQRMRRSPPISSLAHDSVGTGTSFEAQDSHRSFDQRMRRSPPIPTLAQESMRTSFEAQDSHRSFEQRMRRSPPISTLAHDSIGTGTSFEAQDSQRSFEQRMRRSPPISTLAHDSMGTGTSFEAQDSQSRSFEQRRRRSSPIPTLTEDSMGTSFEGHRRSFDQRMRRSPPIPTLAQDSMGTSFETPPSNKNQRNPPISMGSENSILSMSFDSRLTSPPVPALLKKMQMGFNPDEYGRLSSLQSEFANSPPQSRAGSRVSTSGPRIDIDIAVTPRPEMKQPIFENSDETEASIITTRVNSNIRGGSSHSNTEESFESQENEVSSNNGINFYDVPPGGVDHVVGMNPVESGRGGGPANYRHLDRPLTNGSSQTDMSLSRQERLIFSVMNNDDVQAQLSARESELSEKGLIEFSVRLPSQTHTIYDHNVVRSHKTKHDRGNNHQGESSLEDEDYQDPLLSARRNCVRWLYSTEETPKESVLAHLSYLKKGIMMQQQEWGVLPSDTEEEVYDSRR